MSNPFQLCAIARRNGAVTETESGMLRVDGTKDYDATDPLLIARTCAAMIPERRPMNYNIGLGLEDGRVPLTREMGRDLLALRTAAGLSQEALSWVFDTSAKWISEVERAEYKTINHERYLAVLDYCADVLNGRKAVA